MEKIIYYIDPDTEEIVKAKYVEALSKTDYRVVIKENGDVMSLPIGSCAIFNSKEEAEEYLAGNWFVPMENRRETD